MPNTGRFDARFERANIHEGMADDLQEHWGQPVLWYRQDQTTTAANIDPIYDVGDSNSGRGWFDPITVPCVTVIRNEGVKQIEQGLYTVDTAHLTINVEQARKAGLKNIDKDPLSFYNDRFIYMGLVWEVFKVDLHGLVGTRYTVLGVDAQQVKAEELVNDQDFQAFADPGTTYGTSADIVYDTVTETI